MSQPPRKVKVCCFCERWESGGIESFLTNVIRHSDLEKFKIDIATSCLGSSIFTEPLKQMGVRFFELSGNQRKVIQNHRQFFALLQQEQYDVVYLNIFHGLSLYYAKLAERADVPIRIAHSHNTALRKSSTKLIKVLIHKTCKELYSKSATDLWACSESAAEFLFSRRMLSKHGFYFIRNGIEVNRFRFDIAVRRTVRNKLGLENKFVVGNIGRLCYQKNQEFLLDILLEMKKTRPESCLLLVGEGEALESLKEKTERMGLSRDVIFYGTSCHIEQLLCAMDVFIFPSRFEGFGIVAIEAQAAGLPVLCSENIPREAIATTLATQLKLSAGAEIWAETALESETTDRNFGAEEVSARGFDIQMITEQIQEKWVGG